jgi:hypothetical protein
MPNDATYDNLHVNGLSAGGGSISNPGNNGTLAVYGNTGNCAFQVKAQGSLQAGNQPSDSEASFDCALNVDGPLTVNAQLTIPDNLVGIGTADPKGRLQINGDLVIEPMVSGAKRGLPANATMVWNDRMWLRLNQNLDYSKPIYGVHTPGVFAPGSLNVGGVSSWGDPGGGNVWIAGNLGIGTGEPGDKLQVLVPGSASPIGVLSLDVESFGTMDNAVASHFFRVRDIQAAPPDGVTHFCIRGDGNVGIGTDTPEARLDVRGDINVTGDIILAGADCAEEFDIADAEAVEPGIIMVINHTGALKASDRAYDKCVAGVISGAGDLKPGITLGKQQGNEQRSPLALAGKVYCKVDAQFGPIEVGDLLTTSPTPGHAMKATDPAKSFGAVIGKALGSLAAGTGLIPIIVALA